MWLKSYFYDFRVLSLTSYNTWDPHPTSPLTRLPCSLYQATVHLGHLPSPQSKHWHFNAFGFTTFRDTEKVDDFPKAYFGTYTFPPIDLWILVLSAWHQHSYLPLTSRRKWLFTDKHKWSYFGPFIGYYIVLPWKYYNYIYNSKYKCREGILSHFILNVNNIRLKYIILHGNGNNRNICY